MTPEPQYTTGVAASAPERGEARAQLLGGAEDGTGSAVRFSAKKALRAPGMWPARGSIGLRLAAVALGRARVEDERPGRAPAAPCRHETQPRRGRARTAAGAYVGTSVVTGRPSASHFVSPPSSTADARRGRGAQHEPQARGGRARLVVVGDDERVGADAGRGHDVLRPAPRDRPGMAAAAGRPARAAGRGEVALHVQEHGARDVAGRVRVAADAARDRDTSARRPRGGRAPRSPRPATPLRRDPSRTQSRARTGVPPGSARGVWGVRRPDELWTGTSSTPQLICRTARPSSCSRRAGRTPSRGSRPGAPPSSPTRPACSCPSC